MKISYKHWSLLILVALALTSLFLPMLWEKDLYPRHLRVHQRVVAHPQAEISQMPSFSKYSFHEQATVNIPAWVIEVTQSSKSLDAQQLVQQLRQQGYASFLSKTVQSPTQVQIFIGPYSQEQAATEAKQALQQQLHLNMTVIPYNPTALKEV